MIDITNETWRSNRFGGSERKRTLIYDGSTYMVKFPDPVRSTKKTSLSYCSDPQKLDLKAWESDFLRFFLCGEMFATILSRTEPTKRLFDTMLVIVDDIFLNRRLEFLVTMVDAPIVNLLL